VSIQFHGAALLLFLGFGINQLQMRGVGRSQAAVKMEGKTIRIKNELAQQR
jgi:hypothetical protein